MTGLQCKQIACAVQKQFNASLPPDNVLDVIQRMQRFC